MKRMKLTRFLLCLALVCGMVLPVGVTAFADEIAGGVIKYQGEDIDFITAVYTTPEEKLATMSMLYTNDKYELWVQIKSGEVAVKDLATGQILFTNPYDVADSGAAESQREELLSQIFLSYKDKTGTYSMNSYHDSVRYDQVEVNRIRGGVRVQYTIGETVKRKLAPRQITESRFESLIIEPILRGLGFETYDMAAIREGNWEALDEIAAENKELKEKLFNLKKIWRFYMYKNPYSGTVSPRAQEEMLAAYPYCETEALYVLTSDVTDVELTLVQQYIETYTEYTMDDMQSDHNLTGYVMTDDSPPVFQLALEYLLEDDGFTVRLPARGITFDSSLYKLLSVSVLPYFGAGKLTDDGYTFVPDGAGAIIGFEDVSNATTTVAGDLYGTDFSFHTATGGTMETWRMPVYGVVSDKAHNSLEDPKFVARTQQGYVAFMTEGDALTRLTSFHGGSLHSYNTVYPTFYPRQVDSYPLAGITVSGGVATYEQDAPRTYVGNFTTKYRFLWEEEATYVGMAEKYREYLTKTGVLSRLDVAKVGESIPLYINSFGDIDSKDYILGVPVDTKTTLTTFEQAQTMISLLKGKVRNEADAAAVTMIFDSEYKGQTISVEEAQARLDKALQGRTIDNLNLIYTGWYNGGMVATPASKLVVDKVLGGINAAKELSAFAKENGATLFYDLDYTFVAKTSWFDNFNYDTDAAKTVEGAMTQEKKYNSSTMKFSETEREIISANALQKFYGIIGERYSSLGSGTLSFQSLGGNVHTDHTEDSAINREESKNLITEFLNQRSEEGETLVSSGNAYTWGAADNILSVPLDSSSRLTTTREVPFIGIVLHGSVDFSGPAINLSGDYQYNLLKAIENGATVSFTLSYDNTSVLKSSGYSNYYSIQFSIWFDDLIETYSELNEVLKNVRTSFIVGHEEVEDRVIEVTYDNGVKFLLNYNNVEVELETGEKIGALDYTWFDGKEWHTNEAVNS